MDPCLLTVYRSPFPKLRLGRDHDGGYIIADLPDPQYDLFLSAGIADDISFETDFLDKYNTVPCIAYDGTIHSLPDSRNPIMFVAKNIGSEENDETTNLHVVLELHSRVFLKMDIEGAEIPWIKSLEDHHLDHLEQIVMEFHWPFTENEIGVFERLNKHHVLIHFHANNTAGIRAHLNVFIPNVFECTYLHKRHFTRLEFNTDPIPGALDRPNAADGYDIPINHPPFVFRDYHNHHLSVS